MADAARLLAALLVAAPSLATAAPYAGTWTNADLRTRGVTKVAVTRAGGGLRMQVWGQCHPKDCDWGTADATAFGDDVLAATFDQGFAERWVLLRPRGTEAELEVLTRYTDSRAPQRLVEKLVKGKGLARPRRRPRARPRRPLRTRRPRPSLKEDCLSFDSSSASLQQVRGSWKVTAGKMWLLDFGGKLSEARAALGVIRRYQLDRQCFVGRGDDGFTYWLTGGAAPAGSMPGEDCLAFTPGRLEVKQAGGRWKVADGDHWLFDFGSDQGRAREALAVIRRYGFTKSCFIGRPKPSMKYLVR